VNIQSQHGKSPLYLSSECGHDGIVQQLLSAEADVDLADVNNVSPLHVSVECGHVEVVEQLIKHGAGLNWLDNCGMSPLHKCDDSEVVSALLSAGAQLNLRDDTGNSALQLCAERGHVEVVRLLLASRADVRENENQTPLERAKEVREGHGFNNGNGCA